MNTDKRKRIEAKIKLQMPLTKEEKSYYSLFMKEESKKLQGESNGKY